MRRIFVLSGIAAIASATTAAHAQDGATLYKTYCAICREGPRADEQAPSREAMKRLSAQQVLDSLEKGSICARTTERSRA